MKKFLLSAFVIVSFLFYAAAQKILGQESAPVITPNLNTETQTSFGTNPPATHPNMIQGQGPGTMMHSYKDGTYTGNVADAFYGYVQVKAVVSGGKITDVQFLDYPHDRRTSIEINSQATPLLRQEAIQAQSANVNIISGATETSRGFRESLSNALSQAI